jgi:NAD(P)H-binding
MHSEEVLVYGAPSGTNAFSLLLPISNPTCAPYGSYGGGSAPHLSRKIIASQQRTITVSNKKMTVIALVGSGGNFGYKLLPVFVADERISKIHTLSRRAKQPAAQGRVVNFKIDYADPETLEHALKGCDVLVNAMGTNGDHEHSKVALVDVAAKVGIKVYIPRYRQHPLVSRWQLRV